MDIVKMSPLTALLAEEKKKGTRKKLTLIPSIARWCAFVFFLFSRNAYMETTREQKHNHRERRPMMHSANEHAPRFLCYVLKRTSIHISFSYFFMCAAYSARPKTKGKRDLSFSLILTYIHIYATKVMTRFFFLTRTAISLTAKVYDQ
jgi:hypothetical protein